MKLFFTQIESVDKSYTYEYGDVCADVMGRFLLLAANRFLKKFLKKPKQYTMKDVLDSMADLTVRLSEDEWGPNPDVDGLEKHFTKPNHSKPSDVLFGKLTVDGEKDGIVIEWDYTPAWYARQKKKEEREVGKVWNDFREKRLKNAGKANPKK